MNEDQIRELFEVFANKVTETLQGRLNTLTERLDKIEIPRQVREYHQVEIRPGVTCDEPLDIVKTLPEFNGDETKYVSWRHAAHAAYKLFEPYEGSSKHYQATAIIRNKITGRADATLASFNTTLNFHAIIARLDFSFADKRPIYLVEQDLSTLKQGRLTVESFYEVVERKLTLIINKVAMSHDGNSGLIDSLNSKYRADALRVFISGLNKPLCDILFSAKPDNLPSALALAQELVSNQNRFAFANAFHSLDYRPSRNFTTNYQAAASNLRQTAGASERPIPMDVDPSTSRYRAHTNRGLGFGNKPNNPFSRSNTNTAVERKPFGRSRADGYNHTVEKIRLIGTGLMCPILKHKYRQRVPNSR